jgi:endoglucanase
MADLLERETAPPESIDAIDGSAQGEGPAGFSAALLPFLAALGRSSALQTQELRLRNHPVRPDAYYEQVLNLFATGWRELRFAFAADGSLVPAWRRCSAPSS